MSTEMRVLYGLLVNLVGLFVADAFGLLEIHGLFTFIFGAVALGVINVLVRPVVTILSLMAIVLTFGLFIFVINALMLWLTGVVVGDSFQTLGFWHTIGAAIVMSLVNFALHTFLKDITKEQLQIR